jgi:ribonucleotide reductase alpha subunit
MHFYAWKKNLKTGMYYLRSKASASAGKFSINPELEKGIREKRERGEQLEQEEQAAVLACSLENKEDCMMCSS